MKKLIILSMAGAAFAATPGETTIAVAKAEIAKHADYAPSYNALAMAYVIRADETADPRYYAQAEDALERCLRLAPDLYEGNKTKVLIQLGRHEYAEALESATKLNKRAPDDVAVYGYLVDADVALGNYKDAVTAAQWMLDLRPGNIPGLSHAAMLRELHGNLTGALELMQLAYESMPPAATFDRASMLTRIAHVKLLTGDAAKAEQYAKQALDVFPDCFAALAELARVRIAGKQYSEAVALLTRLCSAVPRAEFMYARAEALELAGQTDEAKKAFDDFERKALAEKALDDNANHELVAYFVDHEHEPAKALAIAQREVERRKDVFTLDCHAWALAAMGQYEEAGIQMKKATQTSVKDPRVVAHAAFITEHLASQQAASR